MGIRSSSVNTTSNWQLCIDCTLVRSSTNLYGIIVLCASLSSFICRKALCHQFQYHFMAFLVTQVDRDQSVHHNRCRKLFVCHKNRVRAGFIFCAEILSWKRDGRSSSLYILSCSCLVFALLFALSSLPCFFTLRFADTENGY